MSIRRHLAIPAAAVLSLGLLTACASSEDTAADAATSPAASACALTMADPWVKAQDEDMTGAFGVFTNSSDADITITEASSPSAGMMEIHEVVDQDGKMVMQPKEGGLVVPAGGSATLKPGSDHLMLMKLPAPIEAGDEDRAAELMLQHLAHVERSVRLEAPDKSPGTLEEVFS